jgi:hypothetical protein
VSVRWLYGSLSARQPDGSVIVEESALEAGQRAICPVYPFCDR